MYMCKYIAKVLGLTDYRSVADRYRSHLSGKTFAKRRFSPEEDKIILDYVEQHGSSVFSGHTLTGAQPACSSPSYGLAHGQPIIGQKRAHRPRRHE